MTDDSDDTKPTRRPLFDYLSDEERARIRRAEANCRKHAEALPVYRQIHRDTVNSEHREEYRANTINFARKFLRDRRAEGLFIAEGLEAACAEDLGRWLIADDPARLARIAPQARFWHQAARGAIAKANEDGVPVPTALREMAGRLARMTEPQPQKKALVKGRPSVCSMRCASWSKAWQRSAGPSRRRSTVIPPATLSRKR